MLTKGLQNFKEADDEPSVPFKVAIAGCQLFTKDLNNFLHRSKTMKKVLGVVAKALLNAIPGVRI